MYWSPIEMAGVESTERWQTKIKSLKDGIAHIYETKEFADVVFTVSTRKFKGHRLILGARSPKLAKMLLKTNSSCQPVTNLIIDDVTEEGFENLLHYIYTDELKEDDNLLETYRAAKMFEQQSMLTKCKSCITKWEITISNVCHLLNEASDIDVLKTRCLTYVRNNAASLLTSEGFLKISDENLRELIEHGYFKHVPRMILVRNIMCWGRSQFPNEDGYEMVRDLLLQTDKPLLGKLGIEKLSSDELAEVVSTYKNLLTLEESMQLFVHAHKNGTDLPNWCSNED